ncbi:extracellular solute-binding protein [Synechocystis sp. LKSZ1]|uniref:sugar ABC transporter substrate-binding protein n=1 Tax=Synechocystis sp. LKSZ1 TaxID=3144951 RepID=UPI00336C24E7
MFALLTPVRDILAIAKKQLKTEFSFKKWLTWRYLLLLLVFSLTCITACSNEEVPLTGNQLQGNLLIWHSLEPEAAKLINDSFQEFEQLNPNVKIQSIHLPKEQIISKFIGQSQKGFGASALIELNRNLPALIESKRLRAIAPAEMDLNRYFPANIQQIRYQDKLYGIPLKSSTQVLCYNQAKLQNSDNSSLSQPPKTLDELIERAKKGYSIGMVSNFEDTFWGIGNFGGYLVNDQGQIEISLAAWSKWLTWLKQAVTQRNFVILRTDHKILDKAFLKGFLTYYVCNSSEIATFKKILKENLKVALLPGNKPFKATPFLYTETLMINRSTSDNESALAIALGKFLTNPEHQLQGIVQTESLIPTNRQVLMDQAFLPIESVLLEQAKTAVAIRLDNLAKILPSFDVAESLYQSAIAGEISTEQAAQELTELINRQLGLTMKPTSSSPTH